MIILFGNSSFMPKNLTAQLCLWSYDYDTLLERLMTQLGLSAVIGIIFFFKPKHCLDVS